MPSMPGIIMSTITASNGIARASSSPSARVRGEAHVVALARQQRLEDLAHDLLVVDDQDRAGRDVVMRASDAAHAACSACLIARAHVRPRWPTRAGASA